MGKTKYIGKAASRVDALEKVLGTAKYLGDMSLSNMLYARALRSDLPHARIVHLDTSPALKVPGVISVITGDDFINHGVFGMFKNQYLLAHQIVRHVGEGIAVVAAVSPEAALAGVKAIHCELEPLPGVYDMKRALDPDAPIVGPQKGDGSHPNLLVTNIVHKDNPQEVLAKCKYKIDQHYKVPHQDHAYLETEGALAIPEPDNGITIYSTDQNPFICKRIVVAALGLPEEKVRLIQPPVGGTFGGKNDLSYQASAQVALLALKTGRPVRMTFSREESMLASYMRDAMNMHVQLGADEDGTLRACNFDSLLDSGGYQSGSYLTTWRAVIHAMGAYRYDACDAKVTGVYTNNGYSGAFRGFGNPEVCFAIEQAVDEMADLAGIDPLDFRLKNCLREGDEIPHGQKLAPPVGLTECLLEVRRESDWDNKRRLFSQQNASTFLKRGIGVACIFHGISLGAEGADDATSTLKINEDNTLTLTSGLTDYGQGSRTVFTLIVAEAMGIEPHRIRMERPDTNTAIDSGPTVSSRSTVVGGNAAKQAGKNLANLLNMAAADLLKCDPSRLSRTGEDYIGPDEEPVSWEEVVSHARSMGLVLNTQSKWGAPEIEWSFETGRGRPYFGYHYGAQIAEVEVDVRTGKVVLVDLWAAHDSGKIIFPQGAYGQAIGGISQGVGYALLERIDYDNGYLQNRNFDEYLIPTSMDMPDIHIKFVETDDPIGPYGAKNIAEPCLVPTAPAILNAIAHATNRRIRELPANLERVLLGHDLYRPAGNEACKHALLI